MKTSKSTMKILKAILANPRQSDRKLADLTGVSQPTVTRQRTAMQKAGMIIYTAYPDLAELGFQIVAFSEIEQDQIVDPIILEKLIQLLKDDPEVVYAVIMPGKIFVTSMHRDIDSYTQFKLKYTLTYMQSRYLTTGLLKTVKPLSFAALINSHSKT